MAADIEVRHAPEVRCRESRNRCGWHRSRSLRVAGRLSSKPNADEQHNRCPEQDRFRRLHCHGCLATRKTRNLYLLNTPPAGFLTP